MLRVASLWRFPVKSAQGHEVDRVDVDEHGIVGDRRWALQDVETGNLLTARRSPELLFAVGAEGALVLPNGERTADPDVLSRWIGRSVRLVSVASDLGGEGATAQPTYEFPADPLDGELDWKSWQGPSTAFVDATSVSMITTSTLGDRDPRRFRINVVVSGASHVDEEVALVGSKVRVGTAVFEVIMRIPRCVMVTRSQPGLERDLDVLRDVNANHDGALGVGMMVVSPGAIAVGDPVQPLT